MNEYNDDRCGWTERERTRALPLDIIMVKQGYTPARIEMDAGERIEFIERAFSEDVINRREHAIIVRYLGLAREGMTAREIADEINVTQGWVHENIRQAIKRLRHWKVRPQDHSRA